MLNFIYLPHFQIPLTLSPGRRDYAYRGDTITITALEVARGWELRFAVSEGARFAIVVEGRTLAEAEAALEDAIGRACDVMSAALMQASAEARHAA